MQKTLLSYCNLRVFSDPVIEFIFRKNQVIGFHTKSGKKINCKKMILTTGTFLNGLIHIGDERTPAGRHNEKPSTGLSEQLEKFQQKKSTQDFDKASEDLRLATRHLGMIVGKVDVEELLGSIFNDFCIGK